MKRVTNLSDVSGKGERLWKGTRTFAAFPGLGDAPLLVDHLFVPIGVPMVFLHLEFWFILVQYEWKADGRYYFDITSKIWNVNVSFDFEHSHASVKNSIFVIHTMLQHIGKILTTFNKIDQLLFIHKIKVETNIWMVWM